MINERDKYRHPPPPVGYVQTAEPTLKLKKAAYEDDPMYILMQELLNEKVYDIPDITIYEEFIINPSSEDEIEEVPFVPVPKVVETVDITEEKDEANTVPSINIKKERVSPEPPVVTKDSVQTTAKESSLSAKESEKEKQKQKKRSYSRRKKKHKKRSYSYSSDSDSLSESYVGDSDSKKRPVGDISDGSRSPTRKKSERKSRSKSHHRKERKYSSDSDSHSRSDRSSSTRKKVSGRKSRTKSHHKKERNYSSDSDCHSRSDGSSSTRKKVSERKSRTKSHHRKKSNYGSDSDSCSRKHRKRSSSRSGSGHRHRKEYSSYSDEDRYYKKRERHSYKRLHAKDERQYDFQEDDTDQDSKYLSSSFLTGLQDLKKESLQNTNLEPDFLHGDYYCKVCNVSANNELTYESHLKGKKHKKNVENQQREARREATLAKHPDIIKAEEISNEATNNPVLCKPTSKYPEPPVGYYRQKLDVASVIQDFLNSNTKFPSPGLHKVKEIRGPSETLYYCGICDCTCSYNSILQHLGGYKHQLNSLNYYRSDLYEMWKYKPKFQIQNKVTAVLEEEEKKYGKGFVQVEKDCKVADTQNAEAVNTDPYICSQPSTSYQSSDTNFYETYKHNSLPDPTKSGYYCKLCDSHSNSESMWNAHIIGKRHLANLKKNPGIAPSKSKYIRADRDTQPILFKIIKEGNENNLPIVGLDQIREIRKQDINGLLFTCFLCGASIPSLDILNHILSTKHREKYLSSIKHPEMETLKNLQVSETYKTSILEEICGKVQEEKGMGMPDVFFAKR